MRRALRITVAVLAAGCSSPSRSPSSATASVDASVDGPTAHGSLDAEPALFAESEAAGALAVENDCLQCHARGMLEQQALTPAQWSTEVTKMRGWGAPVDDGEEAALVAYLAARRGPGAPAAVPPTIPFAEAEAAIAALPDGELAHGDARRGATLYAAQCAPCHGVDGGGGILGVRLVDRPVLYRVAELARTVRNGRGRMPAFADLRDTDIAAIVAHLRSVKPDPRL